MKHPIDMKFMRRAMQLARLGREGAHPNPMVGAVIVDDRSGLIVGEGWHRHCGEGHAEVNAVAAAEAAGADFACCTIYVTLEPCAHYGKTPPCAALIADKGIPRVVVGCVDPFAKVAGRGISMLREAGAEVVMAPDDVAAACRELNPVFMTAHTHGRPYVVLKWARSADGYVDRVRTPQEPAARLSTAATSRLVHKLRADVDAISVGSRTELLDRPRLDCRLWPGGRNPRRVSFRRDRPLDVQLAELYRSGVTSLLVEGGPTLLDSFLASGLWDLMRVETSPVLLGCGVAAPSVPASAMPDGEVMIGRNSLKTYKNTYK
ncbi:MAG: bifunctional diaminohydroxyphosphoribosylaminopyrimidine deaminase/5-amino-6-(5-phosphoribosylamino)uracil reductase RibD [Muribaculaceae bacterium]|nr:bifunctional diaminohydroxyphosphoribosylaminopyrimidine deaminase/5-amino-6-(5-phosphoribosylamino)uracil reductase RibD [Muribaculaceae bacterium]